MLYATLVRQPPGLAVVVAVVVVVVEIVVVVVVVVEIVVVVVVVVVVVEIVVVVMIIKTAPWPARSRPGGGLGNISYNMLIFIII